MRMPTHPLSLMLIFQTTINKQILTHPTDGAIHIVNDGEKTLLTSAVTGCCPEA